MPEANNTTEAGAAEGPDANKADASRAAASAALDKAGAQFAPTPSLGRIVHYVLSETDAKLINERRNLMDAQERRVFQANRVTEGEVFPLVITKCWGSDAGSAFNGQVMLDGNDTYWATSRSIGEGPGRCFWPPRV